MPPATRPVVLRPGVRYVPLDAETARLLGAPSASALRARAQRAARAGNAEQLGFERRGGRWFVLLQEETR